MRMLMVSPTPKRLLTQITKIRSLILAPPGIKFVVRSNLRNFAPQSWAGESLPPTKSALYQKISKQAGGK